MIIFCSVFGMIDFVFDQVVDLFVLVDWGEYWLEIEVVGSLQVVISVIF